MNVILVGVPSHNGILGNVEADQAPHLARKEEATGYTAISITMLEEWIHQLKHVSKKEWKLKQSKSVKIKTDCKKWTISRMKLYFAALELAFSHTSLKSS